MGVQREDTPERRREVDGRKERVKGKRKTERIKEEGRRTGVTWEEKEGVKPDFL